MATTTGIRKNSAITLAPREVEKLFSMSTQLADLLEDILEARMEFKPEFLRSLKKALKEARAGKVKKVESLAELRA